MFVRLLTKDKSQQLLFCQYIVNICYNMSASLEEYTTAITNRYNQKETVLLFIHYMIWYHKITWLENGMSLLLLTLSMTKLSIYIVLLEDQVLALWYFLNYYRLILF